MDLVLTLPRFKIANSDGSIQVGSSNIQPSTVVRDLGLHLDSELSMKHHVTKVAAACYYHLRRLRQIRRRMGQEVASRLVLTMVISRLDYCNAALACLPQATISPLQRVQNSAARMIFELSTREHVVPCLLQLHWLPVRWRVQFELCCVMHSIFHGMCPAYLSNIVEPVGAGRTRPRLHFISTTDFQCLAERSRRVTEVSSRHILVLPIPSRPEVVSSIEAVADRPLHCRSRK